MSPEKIQTSDRDKHSKTDANVLPFGASPSLAILSQLLLSDDVSRNPEIFKIAREEFEEVLELAQSHHVIVRAMARFLQVARGAGDSERCAWAEDALRQEQARIENAVSFLQKICVTLEADGCHVVVIKSLDHWPDLGSDLDLYTDAAPPEVIGLMQSRFNAQLAARSWGDRMANKWNFEIPGLPEAVEVHMRRLGQTGEQASIAGAVIGNARSIRVDNRVFRVASAEVRLMICTLQRMYRHFYARLCDLVDTAELLETHGVDYDALRSAAQEAGIWEGVATFLRIASDYVEYFRGRGLALPSSVITAARFGGDQISFNKGFLRVPILPHSAKLYASQLTSLMARGELKNAARLSMLPCLAAAAALQYKVMGSDKGIW
jgi:hypothetical protein